MIHKLLEELRTPTRLEELARRLESPEEVTETMLRLLESRGYVGQAYDSSPACGTACGGCSVQNLCAARGSEAPFMQVWRLTPKGVRASGAVAPPS